LIVYVSVQQGRYAMIDLLLATYNSSRFLAETIESLFEQDYKDWRLIIRDGGSTDSTQEIIEHYTQQCPDKIIAIAANGFSSVCENFSSLLAESSAPYVMFCDHDDVWKSDKISKSMSALKRQEECHGQAVPMLLFTDLCVVDYDLHPIHNSFLKYQNLNPKKILLNYLLVQNVACGCTIMINRALADLCGPIPSEALMHDYWLMLLASAVGRIIFVDEPTVLYRQHNDNCLGAKRYGHKYIFEKITDGVSAARERFDRNILQAETFLERYQEILPSQHIQLLKEFSDLPNQSWLKRRVVVCKNRFLKTGFLRNMAMVAII
jgi:glycosyltransferase involved in cell wall biosynthesis